MKQSLLLISLRSRLLKWLLVLAAAPLVGCAQTRQPKETNPAQAVLETISRSLSDRAIGRVEIIQIPPRILTTARVSAEMLEKDYYNKVIIRDVTYTSYQNKLTDAFKSMSTQPRNDKADLRWGVIFYSRSDMRLGAVYFDKFGRDGSVNDMPVTFTGTFFKWLDSTFADCLQ